MALNTLLYQGIGNGVEEIVMGMAHRGRLNVLANFLQKPLSVLFNEFSENYVPDLVCGDGDVKYHLGYETRREIEGSSVNIFLAPNPSHLEAVNSVVEGMARARQRLIGNTDKRDRVLPILLHGNIAEVMASSPVNVSPLSSNKSFSVSFLMRPSTSINRQL